MVSGVVDVPDGVVEVPDGVVEGVVERGAGIIFSVRRTKEIVFHDFKNKQTSSFLIKVVSRSARHAI